MGVCDVIEQSRRDDLESLAYMFIYFLRGSLPWQGIKGATTAIDRYRRVAQCKQKTAIDQLCHGLPSQYPVAPSLTKVHAVNHVIGLHASAAILTPKYMRQIAY